MNFISIYHSLDRGRSWQVTCSTFLLHRVLLNLLNFFWMALRLTNLAYYNRASSGRQKTWETPPVRAADRKGRAHSGETRAGVEPKIFPDKRSSAPSICRNNRRSEDVGPIWTLSGFPRAKKGKFSLICKHASSAPRLPSTCASECVRISLPWAFPYHSSTFAFQHTNERKTAGLHTELH